MMPAKNHAYLVQLVKVWIIGLLLDQKLVSFFVAEFVYHVSVEAI